MKVTERFTRAPLVTAIAAAGLLGVVTNPAQSQQEGVEEMLVIGQAISTLRLDTDNSAGSRLGLTAFQTPASIDVITAEEIAVKGDHRALDAVTRSAGISSNASPGNGGTSVSSRGFTGHVTTVSTYDGARLYVTAGTVTFPADTWTLERVEILRGAGSVINGMGAIGTTINYVPKAPAFGDSDFEIQAATGSFGTVRLAAGGGAQINEEWAFRLDGSHHSSNGYARNADEQRNVFAGSLLFQPSDTLTMKLSIDYADIDASPFWGTPLIDGHASRSHRRNNYNFADAFVNYEDLWTRLRTEWQISPNVLLRNDTYLIDAEREWQNLEEYAHNSDTNSIDRAFYLGIVHDTQQWGTRTDILIDNELHNGMSNRFNMGAEINFIDLDYHNNFNTGGFGVSDNVPVNAFDPGRLPRDAVPTILDYSTDSRQWAVFADNVLQLTDTVSLVAGMRYDRFTFDRVQHALTHPLANPRPRSTFDAELKAVTWRAGLVYQPTDTVSFYAQTSTAADPVTSPVSINAASADFDLSKGRQYEIGVKQQFMGGRGEYTLAWFDITKDNLVTRLPGATESEQIGQQSSDGIEFTLRLTPAEQWHVDFNSAWVNAQFDEFYAGTQSLRGNRPNNVPKQTSNLWLNWTPVNTVSAGAGLRYVGSRYANVTNTATLPSYTVLDASINWQVNRNLSLTLRGRNLTDEDYVATQYASPQQWLFGDPRSWEVSARYRF